MISMFINPIRLLFVEGLFGTTILSLFLIISSFFNCTFETSLFCENAIESFKQMFGSFRVSIGFLFYFICCLFYNLFYILTKYCFSPTLMVVADCLSLFLWMIIVIIFNLSSTSLNPLWWLVLIGEIFVLIGSLVYNEVVICYFCDFEKNTVKEIRNRSLNEGCANINISLLLDTDNNFEINLVDFNNER